MKQRDGIKCVNLELFWKAVLQENLQIYTENDEVLIIGVAV